ncbi:tetratricopeptide repeat protein [Seonamhaeicola marinus]|uniref:Tetratricopeptide repeat protein n=1 Tax=Seonamhaeicola marinus TaxID=1912246 RepID=A0A5D0I726_9FLAO|nr:tetratricopeptide repeat protein [Seonamhaeicola marinus]TYA78670.1 tetratricopeptide repeat protein [Seonamhaeicola marinus]
MKKLIFIFSLLSCFCSNAQIVQQDADNKIDSISKIIVNQKGETKTESYLQLIKLYLGKSPETAKLYIDSARADAITYNRKDILARSYHTEGIYTLSVKNDYVLASENFEKAIHLFDSLEMSKPLIQSLNGLGHAQNILGDFENSIKNHLRALDIAESTSEDDYSVATTSFNIAQLFLLSQNYDKAKIYYEKTKEHTNNPTILNHVNAGLGSAYFRKGEYDKAIQYIESSLEYYTKTNDYISLEKAYTNLGIIYENKGDFPKSRAYYLKALKNSQTEYTIAGTHSNLGSLELRDANYNRALYHYQQSLDIRLKSKNKSILSDYLGISEAYAGLNNYKKAYETRLDFYEVYDSIYEQTKIEKINELETKYETEKKEAQIALQNEEIKTLNVQAENDKLTKSLYGTGMLSFLAIAGLVYFVFKQRIKKNKIEQEKQEAILKQEIEFKKKELTSQTLHLVQKNTFIQELKENLEKIKKSPELFKVEFRRIVMLLKKQSAEDKDWEVFKSYFSEVHNNFDNKLKAIYEDITEKEIRLASFLRMNLSTKEIASMLNVLPESVLKSKYRLKKKLNLDKETDLGSFLNGL